uniref:Uncharacterized protein n=1 Tax=Ditylenchus dipsaci TaxID=166011 RepID=A0A915DJ28_9BILA
MDDRKTAGIRTLNEAKAPIYLFRPEAYQRLYGCINITVDEIPLENRLHIKEGVIFITLAIIYYVGF